MIILLQYFTVTALRDSLRLAHTIFENCFFFFIHSIRISRLFFLLRRRRRRLDFQVATTHREIRVLHVYMTCMSLVFFFWLLFSSASSSCFCKTACYRIANSAIGSANDFRNILSKLFMVCLPAYEIRWLDCAQSLGLWLFGIWHMP